MNELRDTLNWIDGFLYDKDQLCILEIETIQCKIREALEEKESKTDTYEAVLGKGSENRTPQVKYRTF